jgi:hypothetical protein
LPGAQLDAGRRERRSHIDTLFDRIYNDMRKTNNDEDDEELMPSEDRDAIIEVDEAQVAPNMHWDASDKKKHIEFGNCRVEMIEYTHTKTEMFIHSIAREFIISFTNKLRSDNISINERLSLFQQAIVQVHNQMVFIIIVVINRINFLIFKF